MTNRRPSVIVIGAGIIGAASAYSLQQAGAQVTLVDAGRAGATQASFGWINASFFHDEAHFRLRQAGLASWRDLAKTLNLPLAWQGTLCWEEEGEAFDAQRDGLRALGYEVSEVDAAAFTRLEPQVGSPPARALHFAQEGAAESASVAERLRQAAFAEGAGLLRGLTVQAFLQEGQKIVGIRTEAGESRADHVLIAAGTGSEALMAMAGSPLPMLRRPALVLRTRPVPIRLNHILVSELGELRQLGDGSLLMPAAPGHQGDRSEEIEGPLEEVAEKVLKRLRRLFPGAAIDWQELTLAYRPVPQDGLPVIGRVREGLHVACMHSGITLAALTGRLVAQEMLEGVSNASADLLSAYRPGRFEE